MVLKHLLVYLYLVLYVALWKVWFSYIKKEKKPVCTLTVSHAQHCTVNNVKARGWNTKIKILFTSDKKSPPNLVQHFPQWDTHRFIIQRETVWKKTWCSFPSQVSHSFKTEAARGQCRYISVQIPHPLHKTVLILHLSGTADHMLNQIWWRRINDCQTCD